MSDENPYASPPPDAALHEANHRGRASWIVFWMAAGASALMTVATVGGVGVAANAAWSVVPTLLIFACAAAAVWCGRLAAKIYRQELRR